MKSFSVSGKCSQRNKKVNREVDALDKQEIWNNPEDFGFTKVFKVNESRGVQRFDKREMNGM